MGAIPGKFAVVWGLAWALVFTCGTLVAADIIFPAEFEATWKSAGPTDLDRAKAVLGANDSHADLTQLLLGLKHDAFGDKHASFEPSPTLQKMRFVWLKTHPGTELLTPNEKKVYDFCFDPAIAPNAGVIPIDGVKYTYKPAPVKVVIIGGGPGGLTTAVTAAEKAGADVEIHVYEGRWGVLPDGTIGFPAAVRRRDQIVTLQDSVTGLLDTQSREVLFGNGSERIWPAAQNIQIRKVEDGMLSRAKEYPTTIFLHPEVIFESNLDTVGDFHVLLGADGAASWVRKRYFQDSAVAKRKGYGMGMGFARPDGLAQSQALSIFLTLAQTRYLINGSENTGTGYVALHLTENEWDRTTLKDGTPCTFGTPGCLRVEGKTPPGFSEEQIFPPSQMEDDPFWRAMKDGIALYGFEPNEIRNIMRIPVSVTGVTDPIVPLSDTDVPALKRPQALVGILGDAAITVHWWPGRGMNTAIKTAVALGDEIAHVATKEGLVGLQPSGLQPFLDFMDRLQLREHEGRSFPVLNQTGDPQKIAGILEAAPSSITPEEAMEVLVKRALEVAARLEDRPDWPYEKSTDLEARLRGVLSKLSPVTLQEMAHSGPWPTKAMSGPEVHPPRTSPCPYGAVKKAPFEKPPKSSS